MDIISEIFFESFFLLMPLLGVEFDFVLVLSPIFNFIEELMN